MLACSPASRLAGRLRAAACALVVAAAGCGGEGAPSSEDGAGPVDGAGSGVDAGVHDGGGAHGERRDGGRPREGGAKDGAAASEGLYPALYPEGRTQSPLTAYVAKNLVKIASSGKMNAQVFSKIGNSVTASTNFMTCFDGANVNLDGRTYLQGTIAHFKYNLGSGTTPYSRKSLCATVGWSAGAALSGSPSPLEQEIAAISPQLAVVEYGTNDVGFQNISAYAENMLDITDDLIAEGVIPILTSVPPRDDSATADTWVPRYNAVLRGIAQGRQIPFLDFHRELVSLPSHGLGSDGIHPNVYSTTAGTRACVFTSAGLQHGYNVRNLITIQCLDRVKRVVVDKSAVPDAPQAPLSGDGSPSKPFLIASLPFSDIRSTASSTSRLISTYSGCSATQNEGGPEVYYKLVLTKATKIRAYVLDRGTVDIDLHLLGSTPTAASCLQRNDEVIATTLQAGTYHFSLDTFVSSAGKELSGEYLFILIEE
jgi:hypothetical protein